jgi:hypothetical protein
VLISGFLLMVCYCLNLALHGIYEPTGSAPKYLKMKTITQPRSIQGPDSLDPNIQELMKAAQKKPIHPIDTVKK